MPETEILVFDLDGRLVFGLERDSLFAGVSWPDMMEMSPSSLWSPTGQYLAYVLEEELTPAPEGGRSGHAPSLSSPRPTKGVSASPSRAASSPAGRPTAAVSPTTSRPTTR